MMFRVKKGDLYLADADLFGSTWTWNFCDARIYRTREEANAVAKAVSGFVHDN